MTDLKPEEFFIMTQVGSLPFNVVKTEGEAVEICAMIRRSNEPDFIHVIEHSAYAALKEQNAKLRAENERLKVALENASEGVSAHLDNLQHYFENRCIPTLDEVNQFSVVDSQLLLEIARYKALRGADDAKV